MEEGHADVNPRRSLHRIVQSAVSARVQAADDVHALNKPQHELSGVLNVIALSREGIERRRIDLLCETMLRDKFEDAGLFNGWKRTDTSSLLDFMKDAPTELIFNRHIFGNYGPVLLSQTSKSVQELIRDKHEKGESFLVHVSVNSSATYYSVLRGVRNLATWCRVAGFYWMANHYIEHGCIGNTGTGTFAKVLAGFDDLIGLTLNNHYIGSFGMQSLYCKGKSFGNGLAMLDLGSNLIGTHGMKTLAGALEPVSSLVTLRLETNELEAGGAFYLAPIIEQQHRLTQLDLSNNDIRCDGAGRLSEALQSCSHLTDLNLNQNFMKERGAEKLAGVMQKLSCLQTLDVGYNQFGQPYQPLGKTALHYLIEGAKQCRSLKTLNLEKNSIGFFGGQTLMSELQDLSTLKTLNIQANMIPQRERDTLSYWQPNGIHIIV